MDEQNPVENRPNKKRYEPPRVVQVPLRAEEAVLGNCKNVASGGPGGSSTCSPVGSCSSLGS